MTYRMFSLYAGMYWEKITVDFKLLSIVWRNRKLYKKDRQKVYLIMRRWVRRDLFKIDRADLIKRGWVLKV